MDHTNTIVGYYKVWTTELAGSHVDAHQGPRDRLDPRASDSAFASGDVDTRKITQWIFPFSRVSHDIVRIQAFAKADAVKATLSRGVIEFSTMDQLDTYALRVVRSKEFMQ
jgi:hypothetical protein